jgi:hypothetical protein
MVGRVAIALIGASTTCEDACLDCGAYDAEVGLRLTRHDPAGRIAHVGAVKIEPHAPHQLRHARLAEACVGAAGARGGTVEALVNAAQQEVPIKADGPRMPLDDLSNCHMASLPVTREAISVGLHPIRDSSTSSATAVTATEEETDEHGAGFGSSELPSLTFRLGP